MSAKRLLTREEVADRLGIKARWLQSKCQSGEIPCTRLGPRYIRFTEEQVEQIIALHAEEPKSRRKPRPADIATVTQLKPKSGARGPNRRGRTA
ncbi:helix-turn-helix domain-containing protein [Nocardiopsis sp. NPDC006198]|uniref:helix-turn-helix transcriptional regulator n=1 Tax=Nocardiopsis sp. NPDC006198 TaxID=3154472 RepID=UPI0033B70C34